MKRACELLRPNTGALRRALSSIGALALLAGAGLWCVALSTFAEPPAPLRFSEHLISGDYTYAFGIAAADLDGDGDLDLTSADALPHNSLYWVENDGQGHFTRHFIQQNDPERLERHMIADINRDGRPDVVIVENLRGDLKWFKNSGTPKDGKLWERHYITKGQLPSAYDVAPVDLDGDGDLDVAASSWNANAIAWFENDGTPESTQEWQKHLIDGNVPESRTIRAADFDGDGDPDLLTTARLANQVIWYENPGKPAGQAWPKHIIDGQTVNPTHGHPVDMDRDGDLDVVLALGFAGNGAVTPPELVWYENNGKPQEGTWKKHVIDRTIPDAFEAFATDLDGDGDLDVAATGWGPHGSVSWLENPGDPTGEWKKHPLKENWIRANQVIAADLNGDKRPDIAACAERGSLELRWWKNEGRDKK